MKLYSLIFLFGGIFSIQTFAQNSYKYKILYEFKYKEFTTSTDFKNETMMLRIADSASKFQSYYRFKRDSLTRKYRDLKMDPYVIIDSLKKYPHATFRNVIAKNRIKNNIINFKEEGNVAFYTVEPLNTMKWNLLDSSKQIGKYKCIKATVSYAGRNFTAWYSEDIGISEGPYKFSGLPGLILELYDSERIFIFSALSISKVGNMGEFTWNNYGTEVKLKKFQELIAEEFETPFAYMEKFGSKFDDGAKNLDDEIKAERGFQVFNYLEIR